jgi:2-phospho-L-lactate transferase/gluconeogenesis factor (CofD/UPF0052 family)
MVEGIRRALMASDALKVYVCNVATQRGETDGFGVAEHFEALLSHLPGNPFDFAIINSNVTQDIPLEWRVSAVRPEWLAISPALGQTRLISADVVDPHTPLRHDPEKLAEVLMQVLSEKSSGASANGGSSNTVV